MNTHGRGVGLIFGRGDVFSRSVVEGTHSGSNVALPAKFTRDLVDHMGPCAIGVFDWHFGWFFGYFSFSRRNFTKEPDQRTKFRRTNKVGKFEVKKVKNKGAVSKNVVRVAIIPRSP